MIPKFRVFERDRKIMCKVEELVFGENGDLQKISYYWEEYGEYLSTSEIDDVILMQHTGLVDRFGIGIYEGDKVTNGKGEVGIVIYLIQEAGWVVSTEKRDYRLGHRNTGESYYMTDNHAVIGNLYEDLHYDQRN